jgi:hypothetical protein
MTISKSLAENVEMATGRITARRCFT